MSQPLPFLPSALLRLALTDLRKCEMDPAFTIDMTEWYVKSGYEPDVCLVCLAGSVMAKTLNLPTQVNLFHNLSQPIRIRMLAINYLRIGEFTYALEHLRLLEEWDETLWEKAETFMNNMRFDSFSMPDYSVDPVRFHKCAEAFAMFLDAFGL